MNLSPDQQAALSTITQRILAKDPTPIVLTGYAGVGKTFMLNAVYEELAKHGIGGDAIRLVAPTGKAAARVRESMAGFGTIVTTSTIHQLIYSRPVEFGTCPACGRRSAELAMSPKEWRKLKKEWATCPHCRRDLAFDVPITVDLEFVPKAGDHNASDTKEAPIRVVICDEGSMLGTKVYADLISHVPPGATLVISGDPGQLPPVNDTWGPDFDHPTATLTRIHRQAEHSPIIRLSRSIREGMSMADVQTAIFEAGRSSGTAVQVHTKATLTEPTEWLVSRREQGTDATLLTYTNATCTALNARVRVRRGFTRAYQERRQCVVPGDRLLVQANMGDRGLMNGEVYVVGAAGKIPSGTYRYVDEDDFEIVQLEGVTGGPLIIPTAALAERDARKFHGTTAHWRKIYETAKRRAEAGSTYADIRRQLFRKKEACYADMMWAGYGECLTIHKSQGSQWDSVGIVWDKALWGLRYHEPETFRRLLYTAVTRAAREVQIWLL